MTADLADLVSRIIAGDGKAEDELIHRYSRSMLAVIRNIVHNPADAEDVLHEMFLTALKRIREGGVNEPERLSGFIRTVAKNLALRHVQKAEKRAHTNIEEAPPPIDPQRDPLEQLLLKEQVEIMRQVLGELTRERDWQIIVRYYFGEEDKASICADLGLTSAQFNGVKFRALNRFKELCEEKHGGKKASDRKHGSR